MVIHNQQRSSIIKQSIRGFPICKKSASIENIPFLVYLYKDKYIHFTDWTQESSKANIYKESAMKKDMQAY